MTAVDHRSSQALRWFVIAVVVALLRVFRVCLTNGHHHRSANDVGGGRYICLGRALELVAYRKKAQTAVSMHVECGRRETGIPLTGESGYVGGTQQGVRVRGVKQRQPVSSTKPSYFKEFGH